MGQSELTAYYVEASLVHLVEHNNVENDQNWYQNGVYLTRIMGGMVIKYLLT